MNIGDLTAEMQVTTKYLQITKYIIATIKEITRLAGTFSLYILPLRLIREERNVLSTENKRQNIGAVTIPPQMTKKHSHN